jgi:hypothetical protein
MGKNQRLFCSTVRDTGSPAWHRINLVLILAERGLVITQGEIHPISKIVPAEPAAT